MSVFYQYHLADYSVLFNASVAYACQLSSVLKMNEFLKQSKQAQHDRIVVSKQVF